jgi:hypothetical protein
LAAGPSNCQYGFAYARDDARLSFAEDDIRVANLINHGYFDEAQLRRAVDNLEDP